ncbi:4'-phosphopantetheinyl transferase superfamily protein [Pseudoduganella sp. FT26W]|uniref:4'-phosphopantetheinyl transferase superfamily protein n=1 Tax=Duganella aquatilis TaxID=2666082 RepID=A0A844DDY5_9BURK|nr:4'-phosphopantetheinyl transferase superfamily protein [Duganella aquatilis]MRW86009.1 4'-phosphopantetheinyl transferase superfamily protein [Duganella aquatilis]
MNTLAVQAWPGPTPAPQDGLFAILIDTSSAPAARASDAGARRDAARRQIRLAAREALAALLRLPIGDIAIISAPGMQPRIQLAGAESRIGCSFTYDDHYALAAINLRGPVGVDMMRIQDIPDWQAVARDYLGPAAAAALQSAADRPSAFTKAWTRREAALKYHAQQLSEWQADLPGRAISLILPAAELTGHIHIGDNNA